MIDKDICIGCGACVSDCPAEALSMNDDGKAVVDTGKCTGCGACIESCPVEAIEND
jgi:ferredoxin